MKNYLILLLALLAPIIHSNEVVQPKEIVTFEAICYDTKTLFNSLRETYNEYPVIAGKADDIAGSTMTFWIHPKEKSWTIVATKGNLSCIIGSGSDFKIAPVKKTSNV